MVVNTSARRKTTCMVGLIQDSSRRCGNMLAVLCVLLSLTAGGLAWVNHYDQFFTFNCPHGQGIYYMKSQHSNPTEDRQFNFECVDMPGAPNDVVFCSWTSKDG